MTPYMQFRPQLLTFVLFAAMLALVTRHNYRGSSAAMARCPDHGTVGEDLHGGFFIGIITLTAYTGTAAFEDLLARRGLDRAIRLAWVTVGGILATLLTPYGANAWLTVVHALTNPVTRNVISDWRPAASFVTNGTHIDYKYVLYFFSTLLDSRVYLPYPLL